MAVTCRNDNIEEKISETTQRRNKKEKISENGDLP